MARFLAPTIAALLVFECCKSNLERSASHFSSSHFVSRTELLFPRSSRHAFAARYKIQISTNTLWRLRGGCCFPDNQQLDLDSVQNTSRKIKMQEKIFSSNRSAELPSIAPGPLTTGERALLHAMRKLTIQEKESTFGRLVDENPVLADKLRRAGQNGDIDWRKFDEQLQNRMAAHYAKMAEEVSASADLLASCFPFQNMLCHPSFCPPLPFTNPAAFGGRPWRRGRARRPDCRRRRRRPSSRPPSSPPTRLARRPRPRVQRIP